MKKLLGIVGCLALLLKAGAEPESLPLSTVPQIRGLSEAEAARELPVKLRATVVSIDYGDGWFKVHDGQEVISVDLNSARNRGLWEGGNLPKSETALGAVIEIEGITDPGGYSPVIIPVRFHRVGTGKVAPPKRVSMGQLISGSEVSQYVELEGVVWASRRLWDGKTGLDLMVEGHLCELEFMRDRSLRPAQLVDAVVRVRGFSRPIANYRSEAVRIRLTVGSKADLDVIVPPPEDPFESPRVALNELLAFSRQPNRYHRKVTEGVVNFVMPGEFFFIQQGTAGVRVESSATNIAVGDLVEVAAFVDTSRYIGSLVEAVARKIGTEEVPEAVNVTFDQLLHPQIVRRSTSAREADCAGGLVRINSLISDIENRNKDGVVTLYLVADDQRFEAFMPAPDSFAKLPWAMGSEVEVTGVCDLEFRATGVGSRGAVVKGFSLWLRSPDDVRVVKHSPWWTTTRLIMLLVGTALLLLLVLAWVGLLRRQVARQLDVIGQKLRGEAVSAERNRLARDLHDSLEQQLAGVSLQLDEAAETIEQDPPGASNAVALARRMLRHTRLEARRSVWDLRSQVLELQGLPAALNALAEGASGTAGPAVKVQVTGEPIKLPVAVQFQMLRVAQEACANAIKHSGAASIIISLENSPGQVCLKVSDNGKGFVPGALTHAKEPHFGVLGMHERAARIGAELSIVGEPGKGCVVTLIVPATAVVGNNTQKS